MERKILIHSQRQRRSVSILSVVEGLILIGILVLRIAVSYAEDVELERIVVSATKTEEAIEKVGASVSVITKEEIEQRQAKTVLEALRTVPALNVVQSGPLGGMTSVFIRGAKSEHTLVMVDGIEMNDPMSAGRSFDFAHLSTDNIERIEIIHGPQSTLYGSDAIGGVINIITKKGKGKPKFEVSSEGGSHQTLKESIGLSGSTEKLNYSISASRLDSEGISKARDGYEKDGYENTTISSKIGYRVFGNSELSMVARFTDAETDLDDGAYDDDPNNIAWWRNIAGKIAFDQTINSIWDHKLSFSYSETRRKYKDEPDSVDPTDNTHNWFKADMKKVEWQHNVCPIDWDTLSCGFEYEEERGFGDGRERTDRLDRKIVDSVGYYLQNQFKFWEFFFITPGLRVDNHELFGTETTYKISSAYNSAQTGTRFKANWGTGFKAPSLYQLFHPTYGNQDLNPDESKGYDFGFEQRFFNDKTSFDLTYFHNDFKNMVDWDSTTSKYKNIGRAETKGFEIGTKFLPIQDLIIETNFSYIDTKDKETGKKLTRRPENRVGLDLNWAFLEKGNLNLGTTYVGHNWDNSANTRKVKPYTKVDLSIFYDFTKDFQIFGKIENLFDRKYEGVRGYATPGISFYGGVKASF